MDNMITSVQAADLLGLNQTSNAIIALRAAAVPSQRVGRAWLFERSAVEALAVTFNDTALYAGWLYTKDVLKRCNVPRRTLEVWLRNGDLMCRLDRSLRRRYDPLVVAGFTPPVLLHRGQRKDGADGRLSSEQAAAALNISSSHLLKLAKRGVLPSTRVKGWHRFNRADLNRYMTEQVASPPNALISQREATRMLGYASDVSVFRMARSGTLKFILDDKGRKRFNRADVEALIKARAATAKGLLKSGARA